MIVGKAIYYLLTNATDVTDIVSTRIYPEIAQQDADLPFIVYNVTNNEPTDTKRDVSQLDTAQIEVNIYSESYTQCIDLAAAVRTALDRIKGTYAGVDVQSIQYLNEIIDFDEPQRAYNINADYDVRISRSGTPIPQGPPAIVTDGDGSTHEVDPGGTYTCITATAPTGIHYHRVIPWDQNDPSLTAYVAYQKTQGTYDYTPPSNPETIAMLANGYVGTDSGARLAENNRFGNTFRYTNDEGEQYTEGFAESGSNTSSNPRYCIDHLTGLGWYVQDAYNDRVQRTPSEASTYVSSFTYAGFSDWRLADAAEYIVAAHYADVNNSYTGVYTPFVDQLTRNYGGQFWYGTYTKDNKYLQLRTNGATFQERSATNTSGHLLMVRNQYI